ncbi:hypothetical protein [Neobacillus drentensis]|uniref:hypothetical protein n=1 Tax=Neobacillus drentensis TaxID=220684 RepID=UPI003001105A
MFKLLHESETNKPFKEEDIMYIPCREFLMGTNSKEGLPADGVGPVRRVKVNPFLIYSYEVTNA